MRFTDSPHRLLGPHGVTSVVRGKTLDVGGGVVGDLELHLLVHAPHEETGCAEPRFVCGAIAATSAPIMM